MSNKYYIGNIGFKSKRECQSYARMTINNLGRCKIMKGDDAFEFMYNLIRNHPHFEEKRGSGIDYFYIQRNAMNPKGLETMIKRMDGSDVDFSWVYCCQFKQRTEHDELVKSMRSAIKECIMEYKQQQPTLICSYCKKTDENYGNYHVDHEHPSFLVLQTTFLQSVQKPIPSSFTDCPKSHVTQFKEEDEEFRNEWLLFHNSHCNYQILCQTCNLRKKKY